MVLKIILFHDGLLIKSLYDLKENGTNAISVGFPINPNLREPRSKKSPLKRIFLITLQATLQEVTF